MPQTKTISTEFPLNPSTLENIDSAIFEWLDGTMNVHANSGDGWKKTPVIWVSAERAFQTKHDQGLRDDQGTLIYPLFSLQRTTVEKSLEWKGTFFGNVPPTIGPDPRGGSIVIKSQIKQDKTRNFQNADAKYRRNQETFPKMSDKVVYETVSIPMPLYLDIHYKITARSNFQGQVNELVQPFMALGGSINYFKIERNGHLYECFIQPNFEQNDDHVGGVDGESRIFETAIDLRVLGYIMGAGQNEERPKVVVRESAADFKLMRERAMTADEIEQYLYGGKPGIDGGYRG